MKYPKFIKQGDTIGICAPSSGVGKFIQKYKRSIDNLHAYGYQTKETASVRNETEPSNTSIIRAKEVEELLLDQDVDLMMAATGGDFLFDILPHLNPSIMQENPKWIMGASDPTGLVYPITTAPAIIIDATCVAILSVPPQAIIISVTNEVIDVHHLRLVNLFFQLIFSI